MIKSLIPNEGQNGPRNSKITPEKILDNFKGLRAVINRFLHRNWPSIIDLSQTDKPREEVEAARKIYYDYIS
jgi:hypothetical protein